MIPLLLGIAIVIGLIAVAAAATAGRRGRVAHPPVEFNLADASVADAMIEEAWARSATGDAAAFGISPTVDETGDADGQIWLYAARDGVPDRIAVELALPWNADSSHPGIQQLLGVGWELQEEKPGEWLIVTRTDLPGPSGLPLLVAEALASLFDVPTPSRWRCRAIV